MQRSSGEIAIVAAFGILLLFSWYDSNFISLADQFSPITFKLVLIAATVAWFLYFRRSLRAAIYAISTAFVAIGAGVWLAGIGPTSLGYSSAIAGIVLAISYLSLHGIDAEQDEELDAEETDDDADSSAQYSDDDIDDDDYEENDTSDDHYSYGRR
jgi:hypothetical protein